MFPETAKTPEKRWANMTQMEGGTNDKSFYLFGFAIKGLLKHDLKYWDLFKAIAEKYLWT